MLNIIQGALPDCRPDVEGLFREYLVWGNGMLQQEYDIRLDIETLLDNDMHDVAKYAPPGGCLLLAWLDDQLAGCACMRHNNAATGEVKRMYVRPAYRGRGVGRALLNAVLDRACLAGYDRLRLDSVRFMTAAHALYRSAGFQDVAPYAESEIPEALRSYWVFMELALDRQDA